MTFLLFRLFCIHFFRILMDRLLMNECFEALFMDNFRLFLYYLDADHLVRAT